MNLAEVATRLADHGIAEDDVRATIGALPLTIAPFDASLAFACATLRPITRHLGLSLGDRACLALAMREGRPAVTTDRAWSRLDIGVEVRVIR